jgi:hypothetical protein
MTLEPRIELLESILEPWAVTIGADLEGYKNHCYRMIHLTQNFHVCTAEDKQKITIAAAHHDIGIWSDHTVDYLPPSKREALIYLTANGLDAWREEIGLMVDEHHKIRAFKDPRFPLVEAFRKGDLVDFSMGWIRQGVAKSTVKALQTQFPNAGFHRMLIKSAGHWFRHHPISPPPFMKW